MPLPRHLPAPWSIEEAIGCFVIKDATGLALSRIHFENELRGLSGGSDRLSRDEAWRTAVDIAQLPHLLELLGSF